MRWLPTLVTTPERVYWVLTQGSHQGIGGKASAEMRWCKQWESETDTGRWQTEAECRAMAQKLNGRGE